MQKNIKSFMQDSFTVWFVKNYKREAKMAWLWLRTYFSWVLTFWLIFFWSIFRPEFMYMVLLIASWVAILSTVFVMVSTSYLAYRNFHDIRKRKKIFKGD